MFFGLIPFFLGYGLGTFTAAPRYVPSQTSYAYPPYPYPYQRWY